MPARSLAGGFYITLGRHCRDGPTIRASIFWMRIPWPSAPSLTATIFSIRIATVSGITTAASQRRGIGWTIRRKRSVRGSEGNEWLAPNFGGGFSTRGFWNNSAFPPDFRSSRREMPSARLAVGPSGRRSARHSGVGCQRQWNGLARLFVDGQTAADAWVTPETLLGSLDQSLHLAIAEFSLQAVFLHAGVTVWNGAAILIPGRSHAGKSTLTKSLIDAGATILLG